MISSSKDEKIEEIVINLFQIICEPPQSSSLRHRQIADDFIFPNFVVGGWKLSLKTLSRQIINLQTFCELESLKSFKYLFFVGENLLFVHKFLTDFKLFHKFSRRFVRLF